MLLKVNDALVSERIPLPQVFARYLATEVVADSAWGELVVNIVECYNGLLSTHDMSLTSQEYLISVFKSVRSFESSFKVTNNLSSMPSTYRSAKSIILRALKNNVELLDSDGKPRGKTEVEKELGKLSKIPNLRDFRPSYVGHKDEGVQCLTYAGYIIGAWGRLDNTTKEAITGYFRQQFKQDEEKQ